MKLAQQLQALCRDYNVPFLVNDDVDLAEQIDADGIHVGQDDAQVATFAQRFNEKIIGLSVGNEEEYNHSDLTHVDYIGVGPMYATPSKADASEPVGPEMIKTLKEMNPSLPMVAIGGITEDNVGQIAEAEQMVFLLFQQLPEVTILTRLLPNFRVISNKY